MINNDRIVPVTRTDLLSLYSAMLTAASVTITKLAATAPAEFDVKSAATALIADEPVKTLDIDATASYQLRYHILYGCRGFQGLLY